MNSNNIKNNENDKKPPTVRNPLTFKSFSEANDYINPLKLEVLDEFNRIIISNHFNLEKFRDYIYQEIRHDILQSSEITEEKYKEMLLLMFKLSIGYKYYFAECSTRPQRYNFCKVVGDKERHIKTTLENLNKLIKLDEENKLSSTGFVNKTNAFVNILANYSNSCYKQVFGEYIDRSLNSKELPISSIGKYINNKWDIKSCINTLKLLLLSCMRINREENINDLIIRIKKDCHSCSWIEAWAFNIFEIDDGNRIWRRLSSNNCEKEIIAITNENKETKKYA